MLLLINAKSATAVRYSKVSRAATEIHAVRNKRSIYIIVTQNNYKRVQKSEDFSDRKN